MPVTLTIENETSLPDGGPLSYTISGRRGIDIGRDAYLDWALPDPTKTISGKHAEIRFHDGAYWLHDVSRNGTFLNRSAQRMPEPHRLRDGDRIEIGRYMIAVRMDGEDASEAGGFAQAPMAPGQYWDAAGEAAPPISPRDLRPPRESQPVHADFRDWAIDVPPPVEGGGFAAPARAAASAPMDWAQGPAPLPPAPEPYSPLPTPRRPEVPQAVADPGPSAWAPPPAPAAPPDWATAPAPARPPEWAAPPPPQPAAWPAEPAPHPADWGAPPPRPVAQPAMAPPPVAAPPPEGRPADNPWGRPAGSARPEPVATPASGPPGTADPGAADLLARFARGAGIDPAVLAWRDPGDTAEEMGALVRLAADSVKQLLAARTEAKRVARTGSHTTIQALDNNPLKFAPTPDEALRIMLGRPTGGYLDARRAFAESFKDLKSHQVKTYSGMQHALRLLMEDLDPATIEESQGGGGGFMGSRKAKLWDLYKTRWDTLTSPHEDGMVDAFMMFFAECYDRGGGSK